MGISGQISSRPHTTDFPQMVVNSKGNGTPAISGKSTLVKYYSIWPDEFLRGLVVAMGTPSVLPVLRRRRGWRWWRWEGVIAPKTDVDVEPKIGVGCFTPKKKIHLFIGLKSYFLKHPFWGVWFPDFWVFTYMKPKKMMVSNRKPLFRCHLRGYSIFDGRQTLSFWKGPFLREKCEFSVG